MPLRNRLAAEFVGTFWLVIGGCGSAVLAAAYPKLGIGHFNPAVTVGLFTAKRFAGRDVLPYIVAQVVGASVAAGVLYLIASGQPAFSPAGGFASNGYGEHSPGGYSLVASLVCEVVMTFMFLFVILGATSKRAPAGVLFPFVAGESEETLPGVKTAVQAA